MASLKEKVTAKVSDVRARWPFVDHVVRMVQHYSEVNGTVQAGAVTYFGFLSFFPILALAFFVIGYIAIVYPDAEQQLTKALSTVLPGLIGGEKGQISLDTFKSNASTIGVIGLLGVLYSGLGWLSGMREALLIMFKMPAKEKPNFFIGKARDLMSLGLIGFILVFSVALSGAITGLSQTILEFLGIYDIFGVPTLIRTVGYLLAVAATTALFMALFKLLAQPQVPTKALLHGALFGAIGFEILKYFANVLIKSTQGNPAFAVFGVALILLVWIYYFSRVVMYAASWAYTSPLAIQHRAEVHVDENGAPQSGSAGESGGANAGGRVTAGGTSPAGAGRNSGGVTDEPAPSDQRPVGQHKANGAAKKTLVGAAVAAALGAAAVRKRRSDD